MPVREGAGDGGEAVQWRDKGHSRNAVGHGSVFVFTQEGDVVGGVETTIVCEDRRRWTKDEDGQLPGGREIAGALEGYSEWCWVSRWW